MNSNRLIHEKSLYLQQHSDNPVNWYPWSIEAFEKAKKEDMPIFLSIGYSTCHWCHVMAHESFENEKIASILNEHFICIKVDREERPDIDKVYMKAAQTLRGGGGWPLSIFMTPDKKPFFCGTYFPPEAIHGYSGFSSILIELSELWKNERTKIETLGQSVVDTLQKNDCIRNSGSIEKEIFSDAFEYFLQTYEPRFGGFSKGNKFPMGHNISFLLRYYKMTNDADALEMATNTLDKMACGGIHDHLGGGFHRYSTDIHWFVPHFEKMLYDQALLIIALLEAYQITHNNRYTEIVNETVDYILRDMTHSEGGFYSAEDADSENEEGRFYLWTYDEIIAVLGKERGNVFCEFYSIDPKGNFEGRTILTSKFSKQEFSCNRNISEDEITEILDESKKKLMKYREKRTRPQLDNKIMVDWNGLTISALSYAYRILRKRKYLTAALKAADFVLKNLRRKDGRLIKYWRNGPSSNLGLTEDYSFFIDGLIDLYSATYDPKWLEEAENMADDFIRFFWDEKKGGFHLTPNDGEQLISNPKDLYDDSIPSGNSKGALVFVKLAHIFQRDDYKNICKSIFSAFANQVNRFPGAYPVFLIAYDYYIGSKAEIIIAGKSSDKSVNELLEKINCFFIPGCIIILSEPGEAGIKIKKLLPYIKSQKQINEKATFYLCRNYTCSLPTNNVNEIISHFKME
ncbi:MAG: thioredoxin domain-containing protein [Chitinispirillia bacterium]|jgi:uncharacterized protein YyaL (SSP411 family)